jgi:hypothetical protein
LATEGLVFGLPAALGAPHVVHQDYPTYKSCFTVMHEYGPTTIENPNSGLDYVASAGVDGSSYIVQFRLRHSSSGSWSPWTNPIESAAVGITGETYAYEYDTGPQDGVTHDEVEWRVMTDGHTGTNLRSNEIMMSVDDKEISQSTVLATSGPCHGDISVNQIQWGWATVGYWH